ncbi:MAG: MFS transporter [Myxococcota bacterium]|nr:MFS transporter [Myxococcota bacterium]
MNPSKTTPHWSLVATLFTTQAIAVGGVFGAFPVFVAPVIETFDASLTQVSAGVGLIALALGLMGPIWGRWIDGGEFRRIMLCGSLAMTACFTVASLTPALPLLGIVCLVVGATLPLLGPLTCSSLIGKVFVESRGRAMGIASMGPPAGSALFALLAGEIISRWDWRLALQIFAGLSLLLAPLIAWAIPRRVEAVATPEQTADGVWTRTRLLRTRDFWGTALALGIAAGIGTGWGAQLVNFVLDLGYDLVQGARIAAIGGGVGIVGTLGFGILADRWSPKWLLFIALLLQVVALGIYLSEPPYAGLIAAAVLFGTCGGSVITLTALILTQRFGSASLGQALGLTNLFILPLGVFASPLAGALREASGSYALAIIAAAGALSVGAGSLLLVGRPPVKRPPVPGSVPQRG